MSWQKKLSFDEKQNLLYIKKKEMPQTSGYLHYLANSRPSSSNEGGYIFTHAYL